VGFILMILFFSNFRIKSLSVAEGERGEHYSCVCSFVCYCGTFFLFAL